MNRSWSDGSGIRARGRRQRQLRLPKHRGTTAHIASLYPFQTGDGLGDRGVHIGHDLASGGVPWCYDPFQLYTDGLISSPNIVVLGMVGSGKSTAIKTYLHRSIGLLSSNTETRTPRWCGILDPKGEYGPLADALGLTRLQLRPGGKVRLNPLDVSATASRAEVQAQRSDMASALAAAVLRRDLHASEDAALGWSIETLAELDEPTLGDLVSTLAAPNSRTLMRAGMTEHDFGACVSDVRFGLTKLLDGRLAGMFDGSTTAKLHVGGRGVVIDLSHVHTDPDALTVVMIAAMGWLQALLTSGDGIRRVQVWEEIWALLGNERTARWFQSCQKLSRDYGVANISVAHRIADLRAQADDGTASAKLGAGLLADTQTRILFRQSQDQVAETAAMLGLTDTEAAILPKLATGRALWQVGDRRAVVQHHVAANEWTITRTDGALVV